MKRNQFGLIHKMILGLLLSISLMVSFSFAQGDDPIAKPDPKLLTPNPDIQIGYSSKDANDPFYVNIDTFNFQAFPLLYGNINVQDPDGLGLPVDSLTQSDFTVYEDGVVQTDMFEVLQIGGGGGYSLADIIFVMDNSGSMGNEQAGIETNVINFVDELVTRGIDFGLGLTRYGQSADSGAPLIQDNGNLTSDATYFKDDVWQRNTLDGGTEPGYQAIVETASGFLWRPGAQRIIVIITDETPAQGSTTLADAQAAVSTHNITLFAVTTSSYYTNFESLVADTTTQIIDINGDFANILNAIGQQISGTYQLRYKSGNLAADGSTRTVRVEVATSGYTASDEVTYSPNSAPEIQRTAATIALSNSGQIANADLTIAANITDSVIPGVQGATLFYRESGTTTYTSLAMTNTSGDLYEAVISGADVQPPGVDYYITATDGVMTTASPLVTPGNNPHQIAVLPNEPPVIVHTPVTSAPQGVAISISANVTDTTNSLASVRLFYREYGDLTYGETAMQLGSGSLYTGQIPASVVGVNGLHYYIKATDDFGVSTISSRWVDNAHFVSTDGGINISITGPAECVPEISFSATLTISQ